LGVFRESLDVGVKIEKGQGLEKEGLKWMIVEAELENEK